MKRLIIFCLLGLTAQGIAQTPHPHAHSRAINFPDIPGYQTLVCDFHQHTVFSDGSVWPNIRVDEARKDSVDAISLTEHLEYQPHLADIPHPDRNRSYEIASQIALPHELIVVHGAEITRNMPPGHSNAIFIEDANKLMIADSIEVFREARRQGAFVFWNHSNWIAQRLDGIATMTPMHELLIKDTLLHGIEVVNDLTYSDEALQIALDYNLAIIGTSDIHGLVDWQYQIPEGGHRPVTLVYATERSAEAIKEALFAHRTVAWYNNSLIGREDQLKPLIEASLKVVKTEYQGISSVLNVTIDNQSDVEYILVNKSQYTLHTNTDIVMVHPNTTTIIQVKLPEQVAELKLEFEVLNGIIAPNTHPRISIPVQVSLE